MEPSSRISRTVMRRVQRVHMLRPVVSMGTLSAFLLLLALWGIGREVWVAQVFANMPPLMDVASLTRFFAFAFLHTDFVVQALLVLAGGALVWLARETARFLPAVGRYA